MALLLSLLCPTAAEDHPLPHSRGAHRPRLGVVACIADLFHRPSAIHRSSGSAPTRDRASPARSLGSAARSIASDARCGCAGSGRAGSYGRRPGCRGHPMRAHWLAGRRRRPDDRPGAWDRRGAARRRPPGSSSRRRPQRVPRSFELVPCSPRLVPRARRLVPRAPRLVPCSPRLVPRRPRLVPRSHEVAIRGGKPRDAGDDRSDSGDRRGGGLSPDSGRGDKPPRSGDRLSR